MALASGWSPVEIRLCEEPEFEGREFHAEHSLNEAIDMEFREYVCVATVSVGVRQGLCRSELRRGRRTWVASPQPTEGQRWLGRTLLPRLQLPRLDAVRRRPHRTLSFARGARNSRTCCRRQPARRASVRRPRRGTAAPCTSRRPVERLVLRPA